MPLLAQELLALCLAGSQGGAEDLTAAVAAAHSDARARSLLKQADMLLEQLAKALPAGSLLLVLSGQGNTPLCRAAQGEGRFRGERAGAAEQRAAAKASAPVQALAERAQRGVCLLAWPGAGRD